MDTGWWSSTNATTYPPPTVERAVRDLPVRRWLGLTATPQRPDGLGEIMIMQCGPIRHRIRQDRDHRPRRLHLHPTGLRVTTPTDGLTRGEVLAVVHAALVDDHTRTRQICADIARAMCEGRHCLVLSGRTEHVKTLAAGLRPYGLDPLVLHGRRKPPQRRAVHERLADDDQLLLVATDRYIGEGFDCPRLDTLFLTFPISARNRITQYVGRILREHPGKTTVEVHDYLDDEAPMLAAMSRRRLAAYKHLGFTTSPPTRGQPSEASPAGGTYPDLSLDSDEAHAERSPRSFSPTAAQVRAWAQQTGLAVPHRGRLRAEIWQAYRDTHR